MNQDFFLSPQALLARLESLQAAGVEQLPHPQAKPASQATPEPPAQSRLPSPAPSPAKSSSQPAQQVAEDQPQPPPLALSAPSEEQPPMAKARSLPTLQKRVAACTLCDELASTRTQTVFGVGSPNAQICFLGEAPGADEDRTGEPFVGRSGKLLTKIIEACTLTRDEIYILNVVKCRPPGNRNPTTEESTNCKQFLKRQLELIKPEFICCLGAVAAQNLLETTDPIGKLRGTIHTYHGVKVVCTYHPAYLLRNPAAKKDAWDDMKMLMAQLGVKL